LGVLTVSVSRRVAEAEPTSIETATSDHTK
jgi:hypothetical protein